MRKKVLKIWLLFNIKRCRVNKLVTEYDKVKRFYLKSLRRFKYKSGQHTHLVIPAGKISRMASAPHKKKLIFSMDLQTESWYKKVMSTVNVGDNLNKGGISSDRIFIEEYR